MEDGSGDILLGLLDEPPKETGLPLLILVHGLTGCEESRNIMTTAHHFLAEGFRVVRLNLRGAGPSLNHCSEQYHAGRTEDLDAVIDTLPNNLKTNGVVLMGVSLGGNAVLKSIGEKPASKEILAAASVCAPIDLKMAQKQIMAPRNGLYHRYLINRMKTDALNGAPDSMKCDVAAILQTVETVCDFDDQIVAPSNGFIDAEDYYRQCSANQFLDEINIPTLIVHAASDPWIPLFMYLDRKWPDEAQVSLLVSKDGGHVGFHGHGLSTPWHNICVSQFFKKEVGGSN